MKTLTTTLTGLLLAAVLSLPAQAQAILRVNNTGVTGTGIFATAQAAHDAAAAGDILYIEPTVQPLGGLNCTKRLTIIGNGYFLGENPGLQLDARPSTLTQVRFEPGSAGSRITGCTLTSDLTVSANNIVVERNRITGGMQLGASSAGQSGPITQLLIRQNFIGGSINFVLSSNSSVNNAIITNNIIRTGLAGANATSPMSALIKNNVLGAPIPGVNVFTVSVANSTFVNNIMTGSSAIQGGNNNTFNNNISDNAAFGTADGNQANVPLTSLFVGAASASLDGAYQLKAGAGNPAQGTGESGADIGAFGGNTPYRLSGIPNVPTVFQYTQNIVGANLNATISTKSNN